MPEDVRTTLYRLRRGPWGIWIELTASADVTAGAPARGEAVADRVWLDTTPVRAPGPSGGGSRLRADETGRLRHGLALGSPAIQERADGGHTLVTVHRVVFPECDYQPEGLTAALLQWLEDAFGLPPHPVEATFDRTTNRYRYDWTPTGAAGWNPIHGTRN
ncbi:hypothetical protein ACIRP0_02450 [Streptomyces sp. NPDC101733]|uniref:hypothetical protein n=1 Tax=unclassified Streptomyces TaxID=2593676 RepID=UPI0037FA5BC1